MPPHPELPRYTADLNDGPLHYTQAGHGDILLLIHGSLCDYRYWRWQIPALSQHYTVVAPSLRGYWPDAYTADEPSFSIAQHGRDLEALIQYLGSGRPVHVLGHSRGAQVALDLSCRAPALTRSLILADPGFRFDNEPETATFHTQALTLLQQGRVDEALSTFVDRVNGPDTWRQMVSWFKAMVRDNGYTLLSQARESSLGVRLQQATRLECPVLLIGGAHSPARYGSRLDILEKTVPQARRVTIPHASHGMNLANPKAFNQAVSEFLMHA